MTFQEWEGLHCGERNYPLSRGGVLPPSLRGISLDDFPISAPPQVKPNSKADRHAEICHELNDIYRKKNEAYGDSFGKTYQELGIISAVTRMSDKMNRITSLATGAKNEVADESIRDTLKDLANYAIMTLIEMEQEYEN